MKKKNLLQTFILILPFVMMHLFANAQILNCNHHKTCMYYGDYSAGLYKCVSNSLIQNYLNKGWHLCPQPLGRMGETLPETIAADEFNIYPNPVSNSATISF